MKDLCLKGQFFQRPNEYEGYWFLGVTSNFKKDPLEGFLIIFHKNYRKAFLKRLLSEKPKIIEIRQLFVMLQQFENWEVDNKDQHYKGKTRENN